MQSKYLISFALIFVFLFLASFCDQRDADTKLSEEEINNILADSEKLFKENCTGCHGQSINEFVNREWLHGSKPDDIYKSIADGRAEGSMPAFKETFSHKEINEFVVSILHVKNTLNNYKPAASREMSGLFNGNDFSYRIETVTKGFNSPWGMVFLPDNDLLVADKSGELWRIGTSGFKTRIEGVPMVYYDGQGGLLDIELHPDFNENNLIYLSYSKVNMEDDDLSTTAVSRFRLIENKLTDGQLIFEALPYENTTRHYGSRLEFDNNGYLFVTVGERGRRDTYPQKLTSFLGKVHRINDDGSIPEDNPFINEPNAVKSIYSYGHRNPQGMIKHPGTGEIWTHEHGPKGGDEINIIQKGLNYGWPVISYGVNYIGTKFTDITAKEGMEQPLYYWVPSIAPSGMDFVRGDKYPGWKGHLLIGSLKFEFLGLYKLKDSKVVSEERLLDGVGRVRNVKQGPDGFIYVAVEDPGVIYRIIPELN